MLDPIGREWTHIGIYFDQASAVYPYTGYDVAVALFMLQSFVGKTISTDGRLWTIAVEWWNYMLAPIYRKCTYVRRCEARKWILVALRGRPAVRYS